MRLEVCRMVSPSRYPIDAAIGSPAITRRGQKESEVAILEKK